MAKSEEAKKMEGKKSIKEEFIEFINRGSMIDLAVGVAVGGAFTAIVNSLVNDIIMPVVGLILGGVDFTNLARNYLCIMRSLLLCNVLSSGKHVASHLDR